MPDAGPIRARADGGEAWDTDSTAILSEYPDSITVRAMARKGRTIDVSADDVIQVVFVLGGAKRGDTASLRVRRVFGGCMDYVNLLVDGSAGRGARSRSRRNAYMVCTRA